jgi:hypothetical protein
MRADRLLRRAAPKKPQRQRSNRRGRNDRPHGVKTRMRHPIGIEDMRRRQNIDNRWDDGKNAYSNGHQPFAQFAARRCISHRWPPFSTSDGLADDPIDAAKYTRSQMGRMRRPFENSRVDIPFRFNARLYLQCRICSVSLCPKSLTAPFDGLRTGDGCMGI